MELNSAAFPDGDLLNGFAFAPKTSKFGSLLIIAADQKALAKRR